MRRLWLLHNRLEFIAGKERRHAASFFAVATLSDVALAQCRAGRLREGAASARKAFDTSVKAFGPRAGLTGGPAYTLASCSIELGDLTEASKLLGEIDVKAVAQLAGFPDWAANVTLAQAWIAYRRGEYATARRLLASAAPAFGKPESEAFQKSAVTKLCRGPRPGREIDAFQGTHHDRWCSGATLRP